MIKTTSSPIFGMDTKKPPGWEVGAGDEIRTHDIHLGKVALYH